MKRRTLPVGFLLGILALATGMLRAEQAPEAVRNVERVLDRLGEKIETEAESAEVILAAEKLFRRGDDGSSTPSLHGRS